MNSAADRSGFRFVAVLLLAVLAGPAAAGFSCVDPDDAEQRRWFSDHECVAPMVNRPLPAQPLIHEFPGPRVDWLPGTPAGEGSQTVVFLRHKHRAGHVGDHIHLRHLSSGGPHPSRRPWK